jgi:hypothetical protein
MLRKMKPINPACSKFAGRRQTKIQVSAICLDASPGLTYN